MNETNISPDPTFAILYVGTTVVSSVIILVSLWKIYTKAGWPGGSAIIPFYNVYVLLKIIGRPGWWMILYWIPFVSIFVSLIVSIDLSKAFGKGTGFGVLGLWLFSSIGYPILAFGKSTYTAPTKTDANKPPTQTPPVLSTSPEPVVMTPTPSSPSTPPITT